MTIIRERDYVGMLLPLIIEKNGKFICRLTYMNNEAEISVKENDEIFIRQGWVSKRIRINQNDSEGKVLLVAPPRLTILLVLALLSFIPFIYIKADDMSNLLFWIIMTFPIMLLVSGFYYYTFGKNKYFDIKII